MTITVGTYHFGRHHSSWGIWQCTYVKDGFRQSSLIKDVPTYEEAVKETYSLNGWGVPKKIYRKY